MQMNQNFRELGDGETVFRRGDTGDCAYLIESGRIEIFVDDGAQTRVIATLGANELFGEMALLGDPRRSASAVAREPTRLAIISPEYLAQRLGTADPLLRHLLRLLAERCRGLLGSAAPEEPALTRAARAAEDEDRARALARLRVQQSLERALVREEFAVHLQPIVRLGDGSVAGFEALLRWNHPERGRVPPDEFIPVAEESELINRIGHWVVGQTCSLLARLDAEVPMRDQPFVALNLSGRQLGDPELPEVLRSSMASHRIAPPRIKLEVTETLLMEELDSAVALLERCRAAGMKVAIDDFGTGYSSLSYLHRLPADTLKLDRSFVQSLGAAVASRSIVSAVCGLAHQLGMDIVAEGVEKPVEAELLHRLGVDLAQGYLFGPALLYADAAEFCRRRARNGERALVW